MRSEPLKWSSGKKGQLVITVSTVSGGVIRGWTPEFKASTLRLLQEESAGRPCTCLLPARRDWVGITSPCGVIPTHEGC